MSSSTQQFFVIALLAVSMILTNYECGCAKPLSMDDKHFILKKHNDIRAAVKGKNLPKLRWNEDLAKKAQRWANTCNYWHYGTEWGENIAYDDDDVPKTRREALVSSLRMWLKEREFDYRRDLSCCGPRGKDCCHYTQLLWKKTKSVGCGFSRCSNMDGSIYTVCFYFPKGNVPGQKPY